ncbi:gamma-glutamyltransferase [Rhodohalobacter sp. SW132]|uniref:gamma-glutamyltransferase n=1 Tax=Rhodohalobacter sp. SW132 TaxID=2293433 RepID=UPI000E2600FE|nr:gamma-glutamyltransferase [Rhodohalobacter sp. SW132]REL37566.1 gamma-glutamyltransferase [Rhodohalobacter sp. SW132]
MHYRFALIALFFWIISVPELSAQVASPIPYQDAVISSADHYATEAGLEILQKGGNAVDAAIAIQFALAVTMPSAGNIGGGGFMVLRLSNGEIKTLDFREKAPANATRNMFLDDDGNYVPDKSRIGGLASGVPGTVDGMISALERYGTLPLEVIMEPAIALANGGFRLRHSHAESLNRYAKQLAEFESSREIFLRPDGTNWREGHLLIQHELGETLERIARVGRDGFYSGITARLIVQELQRQGGVMTLRDLRNYSSEWRNPLRAHYMGYDFHMMPPPSSGGVVMKQVLSKIGELNPDETGINSSGYIHLLSEAFRRAFADRNYYLGDPDFTDIPLETLMSETYLDHRFSDFSPDRATPSNDIEHGSVQPYEEGPETTHFSVVDRDGNTVAVTTTLNGSYGSYVTVSGAGFLLNNEMDDFSAKPGEPNMFGLIGAEANAVEPNKRMLSSMSPTIVTQNGEVRMVAGAAGGPRIITSTLQNILNVIAFDMNATEAISTPRFHHQWLPDRIDHESLAITSDTAKLLRNKGHELRLTRDIARVHLIVIDEDGWRTGAADPRGDGSVKGY